VRVVVTRAEHQAGEMASRLRAIGAEPLLLPVISIEPPDDGGAALHAAMQQVDDYDWLVVTSVNTVERLTSFLPVANVRIAAIGPGTADALRSAGCDVDLVPGEFVAESLVASFPSGAGRVLLPRAEVARDVLPDGLRRKGWDVDVVTAYRTVNVKPPADLLDAALHADVITFTAPSTVRAFLEFSGDVRLPTVVCIGPVTAAAAREAGLTVAAVADEHTIDGLVETLSAFCHPGEGDSRTSGT
jgi:uroporphyrinogen-III synthase